MSQVYTYKSATITRQDNGIVYFRSIADDVYDKSDLIAILDLMEKASDGNSFLLIMLINEFQFLMTKEARNLFNEYEKAIQLIRAEAVVTSSVSTRIMYNLLVRLHAPKFPFKAFNSENEAVIWLLSKK